MMGIFRLLFERGNKICSEILENETFNIKEYLTNLQLLTKRKQTFSLDRSICACSVITYFSSFIAICKGSVSPSSSTITGAHMLLKRTEHKQAELMMLLKHGTKGSQKTSKYPTHIHLVILNVKVHTKTNKWNCKSNWLRCILIYWFIFYYAKQ